MKKVKLMLCGILLSISLAGCSAIDTAEAEAEPNYISAGGRTFVKVPGDNGFLLVDKDTKVQYLVYGYSERRSMAVIVDSDGKPILYEGEVE